MSLAQLRHDVAEALTGAGLTVAEFEPTRIVPPVAILSHGDPYIEQAETFRCHRLNLRVRLVIPSATAEQATPRLDGLIEQSVAAIEPTEWALTDVTAPFTLISGQVSYPAVDLNINNEIRF